MSGATGSVPLAPPPVNLVPYNPQNRLLSDADLRDLLKRYNHRFPVRDANTFRKAFTHRSYCTRKNENFLEGNTGCPEGCLPLQEESSERLEFLGDAVLNLVVAEYLFERYPDENEGFLTRMRTKLVNGVMLAELSRVAGLHHHILISKQIEEHGGRSSKNVLEDAFEAFIGAMFVDAGKDDVGYVAASEWLVAFLEHNIDFSALVATPNNHKDTLSRYFQHAFNCAPRFVDVEGGGTSAGSCTVCVKTRDDLVVGTGVGVNKKAAENEAARRALLYFGQLQEAA